MPLDTLFSSMLLLMGAFFFLAGTIGMLRFPDIYSRLHALTKADNLGLGLMILGLILQALVRAETLVIAWTTIGKLLLIWLLVLLASTASCHLVARAALRLGVRPWERP